MRSTVRKTLIYILQMESRLVLRKYKPKIIAITGSLGKTSSKDAIYAAIATSVYVRKSEKSYNSELGLPLTILGIPNGWNNMGIWFSNIMKGLKLFLFPHAYPKWLVLEVGIGKPGDMQRTALWLKTDVVVETAIGETPAHIEFFSSRKQLIEEKSKLIKTLKKDGLLVLNADDPDILAMKAKTRCRTITYGFKEGADVVGSSENVLYDESGVPEGVVFRVDTDGSSLPVRIEGVFGRNHLYASLCALTVTSGLKFNMLSAADALKNYDMPPGRMRLLKGIAGSLIIDDTYNSSPFACESALKTLGEIKGMGRKIAVLGDMLELGKHTVEAHTRVGTIAKEDADVAVLIVVGHRAESIKKGAVGAGMNEENIFEFLESKKAGEFLKTFVKENDIVLIKGSQGMRMERAVEAILLDKKNRKKLLVRQDEEWRKKK